MYSALADIHYCVQIGLIYSRDIYALANYPTFFQNKTKEDIIAYYLKPRDRKCRMKTSAILSP